MSSERSEVSVEPGPIDNLDKFFARLDRDSLTSVGFPPTLSMFETVRLRESDKSYSSGNDNMADDEAHSFTDSDDSSSELSFRYSMEMSEKSSHDEFPSSQYRGLPSSFVGSQLHGFGNYSNILDESFTTDVGKIEKLLQDAEQEIGRTNAYVSSPLRPNALSSSSPGPTSSILSKSHLTWNADDEEEREDRLSKSEYFGGVDNQAQSLSRVFDDMEATITPSSQALPASVQNQLNELDKRLEDIRIFAKRSLMDSKYSNEDNRGISNKMIINNSFHNNLNSDTSSSDESLSSLPRRLNTDHESSSKRISSGRPEDPIQSLIGTNDRHLKSSLTELGSSYDHISKIRGETSQMISDILRKAELSLLDDEDDEPVSGSAGQPSKQSSDGLVDSDVDDVMRRVQALCNLPSSKIKSVKSGEISVPESLLIGSNPNSVGHQSFSMLPVTNVGTTLLNMAIVPAFNRSFLDKSSCGCHYRESPVPEDFIDKSRGGDVIKHPLCLSINPSVLVVSPMETRYVKITHVSLDSGVFLHPIDIVNADEIGLSGIAPLATVTLHGSACVTHWTLTPPSIGTHSKFGEWDIGQVAVNDYADVPFSVSREMESDIAGCPPLCLMINILCPAKQRPFWHVLVGDDMKLTDSGIDFVRVDSACILLTFNSIPHPLSVPYASTAASLLLRFHAEGVKIQDPYLKLRARLVMTPLDRVPVELEKELDRLQHGLRSPFLFDVSDDCLDSMTSDVQREEHGVSVIRGLRTHRNLAVVPDARETNVFVTINDKAVIKRSSSILKLESEGVWLKCRIGESARSEIPLSNSGSLPLLVKCSLESDRDSSFRIEAFESIHNHYTKHGLNSNNKFIDSDVLVFLPGETGTVTLSYTPKHVPNNNAETAILNLLCSVDSEANVANEFVPVNLFGNVDTSSSLILCDRPIVNFGGVDLGSERQEVVHFRNDANFITNIVCTTSETEKEIGEFTIVGSSSFSLKPGDTGTLSIRYLAGSVSRAIVADLYLKSDTRFTYKVPMTAYSAVSNVCIESEQDLKNFVINFNNNKQMPLNVVNSGDRHGFVIVDSSEALGRVLVSPDRFILAPGQRQSISITIVGDAPVRTCLFLLTGDELARQRARVKNEKKINSENFLYLPCVMEDSFLIGWEGKVDCFLTSRHSSTAYYDDYLLERDMRRIPVGIRYGHGAYVRSMPGFSILNKSIVVKVPKGLSLENPRKLEPSFGPEVTKSSINGINTIESDNGFIHIKWREKKENSEAKGLFLKHSIILFNQSPVEMVKVCNSSDERLEVQVLCPKSLAPFSVHENHR